MLGYTPAECGPGVNAGFCAGTRTTPLGSELALAATNCQAVCLKLLVLCSLTHADARDAQLFEPLAADLLELKPE